MSSTDNDKIIDDICKYSEEAHIKEILHEYFRRLILAKPVDPVQYLISSIQDNPYVHPESDK